MADDDSTNQPQQTADEARASAVAKMQAAIDAQKRGEEVETDQASLEASTEDAMTAGASQPVKDGSKLLEQVQHGDTGSLENVKVYSPFRTYFDNSAISVSAENLTGPFDVLAGHKNFMTLLNACDIVVRSNRGEERITIDRGIMHVHNNRVTVFLDV